METSSWWNLPDSHWSCLEYKTTWMGKASTCNSKQHQEKSYFTFLDWKIFWLSQIYVLSKRLTEEAAFKYAKDNGIDLISVITTTVAGAFLTSSVPSSIRVLLSPITGNLLAKFTYWYLGIQFYHARS